MKKLAFIAILFTAPVINSCSADPLSTQSFLGQDQHQITNTMGQPDDIEILIKTSEHIFGPIEALWYEIEMGDKIVIWVYQSRSGQKMLYFKNDEIVVAAESFWFKDAKKNPVY